MSLDLETWQQRLKDHFEKLASVKRRAAPGVPVFGLEHGLDTSDLQALATSVRAYVANRAPSTNHALAWLVYAAEIGYRYSGDEYWQTFEAETPGWTVHGDRYWIRQCFEAFHRQYSGAKPSGPWAEHFSIICWPITHGILPQDLQEQLARILYDLRHAFSSELLESPSMLGESIAARSWRATSRFQKLTEQTLLVGQIAAALLETTELGTRSLIHPPTLRRISADLERHRLAREWLRGARRSAQERAQIRGLSLAQRPGSPLTTHRDEARAEVATLGIEPRLVLRPAEERDTSWHVLLEIPDLSHLIDRFPHTRDILSGTRCTVAGMAGRPLARGRCLYGVQRVKLTRWPHAEEVLLQFERSDPQLDFLLRTECLLRPGPTWLFRIASDGLAYESRSLRVRPGERYVAVSTVATSARTQDTPPAHLLCEGVTGVQLDLPSGLTVGWEETLHRLGLAQARMIEVWPAGLGALFWDGEGHGEWLVTERPCLAIRSDHTLDALEVSVDGTSGSSLQIQPIGAGEPVFLELSQLPVGLHTVRISSRKLPEAETEAIGDLNVVMRVRDPQPWTPGASPHGPLRVQIDPSAPTLEQLWEGRIDVTIYGPPHRFVECTVSLFARDDQSALVTKALPPIALPVTPSNWRRYFERHFQDARDVERAYDLARICTVEFAAEELGAFTVRCERDFTPLRWAVRRDRQTRTAILLDDTGDSTSPQVTRLAFDAPCVEAPLTGASTYSVPDEGGLYVARRGDFVAAVIVPPRVRGLADFRSVPRIVDGNATIDHILDLLALARLWGQAMLTGDLFSAVRQRDVLHALALELFRLMGGDKWASAELPGATRGESLSHVKQTVFKRGKEAAVAGAIAAKSASLAQMSCEDRVAWLVMLITRFKLVPLSEPRTIAVTSGVTLLRNEIFWMSELALRLASDPANVEAWAAGKLRDGVTRLKEISGVARAARFLVLQTDCELQTSTPPGELYAGWGWE